MADNQSLSVDDQTSSSLPVPPSVPDLNQQPEASQSADRPEPTKLADEVQTSSQSFGQIMTEENSKPETSDSQVSVSADEIKPDLSVSEETHRPDPTIPADQTQEILADKKIESSSQVQTQNEVQDAPEPLTQVENLDHVPADDIKKDASASPELSSSSDLPVTPSDDLQKHDTDDQSVEIQASQVQSEEPKDTSNISPEQPTIHRPVPALSLWKAPRKRHQPTCPPKF